MIENKRFLGKMDLDSSPYKLAKEDYIDALNITKNAVAANADTSITNIVGNRLVNYNYPSGNNFCIGAKEYYPYMYYIVYNELGKHSVLEFNSDTRTITKIFENLTDSDDVDVLDLQVNKKINNIDVFSTSDGTFLFFLDSSGRPIYINVERFKAGEYTPVTREILDVCTAPPLIPITSVYGNDDTRKTNNLRNKFFRFKYRWVYDDNQKSTFSPISKMPMPQNLLEDTYTNVITNNNIITLQLFSGAKNVKAIEIAMSYAEKSNDWSDFLLVTTINKETESIGDDSIFVYSFYNDSTYPSINIAESIQLFDYTPDVATAQCMPNGNVLMYGGITEGYDNDLEPEVTITINTQEAGSGGTGDLTSNTVFLGQSIVYRYGVSFVGTPSPNTVITIKAKLQNDTIVTGATYTTQVGDTTYDIRQGLYDSARNDYSVFTNVVFSGGGVVGIDYSIVSITYKKYSETTIEPAEIDADNNSLPTWKWSTERNLGIVYYDNKGKTNGVVYNSKVSFPRYNESGGKVLIPYINVKIYHQPPIWAYSYQFVVTKENTSYLFWQTIDAKTDTDYIYLDISNIVTNAIKNPNTSSVLSYSYQDGDRLRVIKNTTDNTIYDDTYDAAIEGLVVNPIISGTQIGGVGSSPDRTFLKVKKIAPLSTIDFVTDKAFVIELYRLNQPLPNAENAVYYELGEQYLIGYPTTEGRIHKGGVSDQNILSNVPAESNLYNGDSYFRLRTIFDSGDDTQSGYASFYCQDRNVADFYISAVNSVSGRPLIIDVNAKRQFFSTLVRFGQAYQPNTNINGLNRFYPNNFDEYDYSYGNIVRLKVRDRFVRVFQNYKVGLVPLFNQISKNADGTQLLVVTDKLLNPIQYYAGDYGIGENAESLASFTFADYFTSNVKGAICRVSNDGVQPISIMYKVNSWATERLPLQSGNYKVYGVFDQKLNQYIIALEGVSEYADPITLSFNEELNQFESFLSYHPEMMCSIGTLLVSFKNGQLYTHDDTDNYNTFYGVKYDSTITGIFNQMVMQKKTYLSLTELSSEIWDCPEIQTSMNSYGTVKQQSSLVQSDFEQKEGEYHASFLRDSNSIGGIIEGEPLKGNYISVKFRSNNPTNLVSLDEVNLKYINSPLNNT